VGIGFFAPMDTPVTAFVIAVMIAWLVANPESMAARLLSWLAPVVIGILSCMAALLHIDSSPLYNRAYPVSTSLICTTG
jgi:hypothetical protein